ncbi:MAG: response regulator [Marinomonas gallaica]
MQHILVIEDDAPMQSFLKTLCESAGFKVSLADTIEQASAVMSGSLFVDLCLLDLGLPDGSGHDFIRAFKPKMTAPIIVISARDTDFDKITALDLGADDYVAKPFSSGELLARIRVSLRRLVQESEAISSTFQVQHLNVNLDARTVYLDGVDDAIHLTPIEFRLLELFLKQPNKVLTYSQIGRDVWGNQFTGSTEKIRVHIAQLRQKIEKMPSAPTLISNAPSIGYRLNH